MLLEQTLATLAYRVAWHLPLALVGLVLVLGAVACLCGKGPYALSLGGAEGGLPVLWQCVVWHHPGLPAPAWAGPRVPRKSLSVSDL